jgi:putative glutamine amidotransferase
MSARPSGAGGVWPPLIGLTTSEIRTAKTLRPIPQGEPTPHEFALAIPYVRAVELAGGLPVIVPPLGDVALEPLLDFLDGLCVPGGPDLDPSTYGEQPHPALGPVDQDVDRFELALTRAADERELPILGICRGAEVLNVARGGSLIQHLPDLGKRLPHRQPTPGTETSHPVAVAGDSLLAEIVAARELEVNSFHHQGIGRLGRNLRPVAAAPDDTIEALEATDRRFCLGVQWHAETLVHMEPQIALFGAFVEAAAGAGEVAARRVA